MSYETDQAGEGGKRKRREKFYDREWEEVDPSYQSPYEAGDAPYGFVDEYTRRHLAQDKWERRQMGMPEPQFAPARKIRRVMDDPYRQESQDTFIQRLAYGDEWGIPPESQAVLREVLAKSGEPLASESREFFEARMGADFSDVRIHTDAKAAESAETINAKAYTTGNDIVFGEGEYKPESNEGKHLLAHELTHVVQQRGGETKVQRETKDKQGDREKIQSRPEVYSAKLTGETLAIKFFQTANSAPGADQLWSMIDRDILLLQKDGMREKYSERFTRPPNRTSEEFGPPPATEWTYTNDALGEIARVRVMQQGKGDAPLDFTIVVFLRINMADGSRIVFKNRIVEPGAFYPEVEATVELANADYSELVDRIVEALEGVTLYTDSLEIMTIFRQADAGGTRTLLQRLKQRGEEFDKTPAEMVAWLFEDLSANHREELIDQLIQLNIVEDLIPVVASDLLENENPEEITEWLHRFHGAALDSLLAELNNRLGGSLPSLALFIFTNLDSLPAEKLHERFLRGDSPAAEALALHWTAYRIDELLSGYTGILDSKSILWNFKQLPTEKNRLETLQQLTVEPGEKIDQKLAAKMQSEDYSALRDLGLPLAAAPREEGLVDAGLEFAEGQWNQIQGAAGVVTGLVKGLAESAWAIAKTPIDLATAAYHLLMVLLFMVSKGAVGSDSVQELAEIIEGIEGVVSDPGAIIQQAYDDTIRGSDALEGSSESFARAEHWSSLATGFAHVIWDIRKGKIKAREVKDKDISPHLREALRKRRRKEERRPFRDSKGKPPEYSVPPLATLEIKEKVLTSQGLNVPPLWPEELKIVTKWQEIRLRYLNRWAQKDISIYSKMTKEKLSAADNAIIDHTSPDDMAGNIKERRGAEIFHPGTDRKADHIGEVRDATVGIANSIRDIKVHIAYIESLYMSGNSPSRLSKIPAEIAVLKSKAEDLQRLYDYIISSQK